METEIIDKEGKKHFVLSRITINGRTFCITKSQRVYEENSEGVFVEFDFKREDTSKEGNKDNSGQILKNVLAAPQSQDIVGVPEEKEGD